jgi:hypothetical protein
MPGGGGNEDGSAADGGAKTPLRVEDKAVEATHDGRAPGRDRGARRDGRRAARRDGRRAARRAGPRGEAFRGVRVGTSGETGGAGRRAAPAP